MAERDVACDAIVRDMRAASQVGVRPFGVMTGGGGLTELVDAGAEKVLGSVGDLLGEGNYA
jgi:phosphoglycolate phosphatase-like HAD superfamily hydrolase